MTDPEPYQPEYDAEQQSALDEIPEAIVAKVVELSNLMSEYSDHWVFATELPDESGSSFYHFKGTSTSALWMRGCGMELQAHDA